MEHKIPHPEHRYEYTVRSSLVILVFKIITVEIIFLSLYGLFFLGGKILTIDFSGWFLFWIFQILDFVVSLFLALSWYAEKYTVTPKQVIISQGLLIIDRDVYNISNIESVKLKVRFWGRIFGFGTLRMYAPTLKEEIWMKHIPLSQAQRYVELIQESILRERDFTVIPRHE